MISVKGLEKRYTIGDTAFTILNKIDMQADKGEFIAVMGPSGSGKSTFLNLLGGLDTPEAGEITVNGKNIHSLNETQRTLFRREHVGFIFQNYQLLPNLTVEENVSFPMYSGKKDKQEIKNQVNDLLRSVSLEGKEKNYPSQLSGGQQQRVAIARALSMNPNLILADEPTGNLDRRTGTEVLRLLSSLHQKNQLTIIMVTHDVYAASYADRIILLKDGVIESDIRQTEGANQDVMANLLAKLNS
ncbi:ABC transporter ATP-binding protein [Rossellomorea marisflavi]|uniref:ABC transporter ATP-binding protein n=1 Tax=Rossellomorea marisflavi TaxID=189381 RepID=A0A5D4RUC8_9BACI|nr:ABC transporter ATP-binding protein [Rossellomorea marisflavi]MCM2603381.1 ABC transporter ATP-binding protein [Rossellomorea marisflavi]TYS54877.1 ABC transporter ATP-binding protein [Rossellomorea marisflavi]VXC58203.1 ABC transporter (ATP-binding protein) involved in resistance to cell wall inhibitors [Bacillus sp. 349Y]